MPGKIIRRKIIKRADVRRERNTIFVFGDNMTRQGLGGQAREMRGEFNAIGIPTKWRPGRMQSDYFKDSDWDYIGIRISIQAAFKALESYLSAGFNVIIPADGLGTGLSELPLRAPKIHSEIERMIAKLENQFGTEEGQNP